MWRGFSRNFSRYTIGFANAFWASVRVMVTALLSAASVCSTRMLRPPPPPAPLPIPGSPACMTYFASASASEWIATVLMPSSRHARWMRRAISPRLAIRIFSNTRLFDQEERLPVLHRLAVFDEDRLHRPGDVRLDLVQELHGLDDAKGLSLGHRLADFDERRGRGRGGPIEGPNHGGLEGVARRLGRDRGRGRPQGARGPSGHHRLHRRRGHEHGGGRRRLPADANLLLTLGDLDLADAGLLDEVDQLLELPEIHLRSFFNLSSLASCAAPLPGPVRRPWDPIRR